MREHDRAPSGQPRPGADRPAARAARPGTDDDERIAQARQQLAEARRRRAEAAPEFEPQPRLVGTLRLDLLLR